MIQSAPLCLYVATTSQGKLRDFRTAAQACLVEIEPLAGLKQIEAPDENGQTFEDNATLKAVYYSRFAPGKLVLADDSGLEVDALKGAPGVRSARFAADHGFAGSPASAGNLDLQNNELLVEQLAAMPAASRTARYRCALVAACDGQPVATASGAVEGLILARPQGTAGFGYDPLFYLPELNQSMAEISLETKLGLSHRGRALVELLQKLR